ncbi:MAG: IS21 family transposase [Sulfitobacter sp.]|nr:IS21 family transposase [Sulfitobacter sp.]
MIAPEIRDAILALKAKGTGVRKIARLLEVSRNTVRQTLRQPLPRGLAEPQIPAHILPLLQQTFARCEGNVVRVQEVLAADHGIAIPYSTLTRWVREADLRAPKRRAGRYHFEMGEEMQFDTSPHRLTLNDRPVKAQCAALVLACCRRDFIQYYPCFTRFEAKTFLREALCFMEGSAGRCMVDNSNVVVASGSGADAVIAPEMEAFGRIFGFEFVAHAIGDANRSARVERPFYYVERNFLPGRRFSSWDDLNAQARAWCEQVANQKPKRSLGMSPEAAYVLEKPYLLPLPAHLPPVYQAFTRIVDVEGYAYLDTNRYSVPERLIGKKVEVYKYPEEVKILFRHREVAEHPRLVGKRHGQSTLKAHRRAKRRQAYQGPSDEERQLCGESEALNRYVAGLKKRSPGRGVSRLRRLLAMRRTYPRQAFVAAVEQALQYGLYDLHRLEHLILERVAGDFFHIDPDDEGSGF